VIREGCEPEQSGGTTFLRLESESDSQKEYAEYTDIICHANFMLLALLFLFMAGQSFTLLAANPHSLTHTAGDSPHSHTHRLP
jgi:hypothetical protein